MQGDQRNIARTHIARARAQTHTHINNHYSRLYKEFFSLSFFFFLHGKTRGYITCNSFVNAHSSVTG